MRVVIAIRSVLSAWQVYCQMDALFFVSSWDLDGQLWSPNISEDIVEKTDLLLYLHSKRWKSSQPSQLMALIAWHTKGILLTDYLENNKRRKVGGSEYHSNLLGSLKPKIKKERLSLDVKFLNDIKYMFDVISYIFQIWYIFTKFGSILYLIGILKAIVA